VILEGNDVNKTALVLILVRIATLGKPSSALWPIEEVRRFPGFSVPIVGGVANAPSLCVLLGSLSGR